MDTPITEKELFAQTRVQQALEAGAHCIDADDVREALDGFKGALDCQFGVHNDLPARINDLETQLFHCRVNAGGSEVLLSGAINTRDRLVDYFRYVEESVPFAKTAEARERGTAIVDGMNWLIREAGNIRLAVQAVKAQRNQLEAELAEARMALDASQGQVSQLEAEAARQADGAWLPWPGGDMPEQAAGNPVDIEQRDGEIFHSLPAESFRWDHLEMDGDVVFWRTSKKARVGCPECGRQPGGSGACATRAALQMTGVLK